MSARDDEAENTGDKADQTDRAAEKSNEAGSYSPEQYPEDPKPATPPLDSESASEPPQSD
jgi:hypothetical protein